MNFLYVVFTGALFALIFVGFKPFSKKDWSYGGRNYDGKESQSTFMTWFIVLVIGFTLLWYLGSN